MEQPYQLHLVDLWGVGLGLVLVFLFFTWRLLLDETQRLLTAARHRFIMSSNSNGDSSETDDEVVLRPVDATSMATHTSADLGATVTPDTPDMDAANGGMWHRLRYVSDDEFVVLLSVIRLPGGKYRLSANDIVKAAKGDRNHVLSIVRAVREGPTPYPPRTPEQLATRRELELDKLHS